MSKLLVSIRSVREAELVQHTEVGILDVKEPSRGGLGASDPETLQQIADFVKGSAPDRAMSFSAGELAQWDPLLAGQTPTRDSVRFPDSNLIQRYGRELLSQFGYVKIGLAGVLNNGDSANGTGGSKSNSDWRLAWQSLFDDLPSTTRSVAVVYADFEDCSAPSPGDVIELAAKTEHCDVVLVDTCHKAGNLFRHLSISELEGIVDSARRAGLQSVVAGSVDLDCLPEVVSTNPDYVGVRGAICHGDRVGEVAPELVSQFVKSLELQSSSGGRLGIAKKKSENFTKA